MDSSHHKKYHKDEFDSKQLLYTYLSNTAENIIKEEMYINPMKKIHSEMASGRIRGETLIDISLGPSISHLLTACEYFNEITILETNELCIMELEKWMSKEPDSVDWSHAIRFTCELTGNSNQWEEKENKLRKKIKRILKCDLNKENPTDPLILEKADCLLSIWGMTTISKDHSAYCNNMKKISSMLKLGGHLVMYGSFNASYFMFGEHKIHVLTINEDLVRMALEEAGFKVECFEVIESKICNQITDNEHTMFVSALKVREFKPSVTLMQPDCYFS